MYTAKDIQKMIDSIPRWRLGAQHGMGGVTIAQVDMLREVLHDTLARLEGAETPTPEPTEEPARAPVKRSRSNTRKR